METIAALVSVIVMLFIVANAFWPSRVPRTLMREEGLRVRRMKRTITRGVKSSDVIEIDYEPIAVPVETPRQSRHFLPRHCSGQKKTERKSTRRECS